MTVYVVHPTNRDLANAVTFGPVEFINKRYIYPDELQADGSLPEHFLRDIRDAAGKFKPGTDYLLINGDDLQIVAFTAELATRYKQFKMLRYDREVKAYVPVLIWPEYE